MTSTEQHGVGQSVLVILVNYHGADDTAACLTSLRKSSVAVDVVVVDNTPNDPELIEVLARYPEARHIAATDNGGFATGNDLGIAWALATREDDWIFILNNDAEVEPDTVARLLSAANRLGSGVSVLVPRILDADSPHSLWYGAGRIDWRRGGGRVPGIGGKPDANEVMQPGFVEFATGCAMLCRREVFSAVGGLDRRYFMYEEDVEFSLRIARAGMGLYYEPSAVVYHKGQGSTKDKSAASTNLWDPGQARLAFYVEHIVGNRCLTVSTHATFRQCVVFWMFFPLILLRKSLVFVRHARWDGLGAIGRGFRRYFKQRRLLPDTDVTHWQDPRSG